MTRYSTDAVAIYRAFEDTTPRVSSNVEKTYLLDEPLRTNYLKYSQDFTQPSWDTQTVIEPSVVVAPDGNKTASRYIPTSGISTLSRQLKQEVIFDDTECTFSVFVKKANVDLGILLRIRNHTTNTTLQTYTATISSGEPHAYGWYRHQVTATSGITSGDQLELYIQAADLNDLTAIFYVWGAQLEQGDYMTSYIPTTASAVTRNADNLTITNNIWGSYNTTLTYIDGNTEEFTSQIIEDGYWFPKTHDASKDKIVSVVCEPIVQYANPNDLFGGARRGVYFDVSDSETVFQDSVGTIPALPNDPVGLILDKSQELVVGTTNLVEDGDFTNNLFFWNVQGGVTANVSAGICTIEAGNTTGGIWQDVTLNQGQWTKLKFKARKVSGNSVVRMSVRNYGSMATTIADYEISSSTTTDYELTLYEESNGVRIYPQALAGDGVLEISDIELYTFAGHHAYQKASTKRPILRSNTDPVLQTVYYLEFDGTNDLLETSYIDFTNTDAMSVTTSVRKNDDSNTAVIFEFSGDFETNSGVFKLESDVDQFVYGSRGTSSSVVSANGYSANVDYVVTGHSDISDDSTILRVDGVQVAIDATTDQGGSDYGTYKMYIGAQGNESFFFDGRMYSLLALGSKVGSGETNDMEYFTSAKSRGALT